MGIWILDMERVMKERIAGEDNGAEVTGVVAKQKDCQGFQRLGVVYFCWGHRSSFWGRGREQRALYPDRELPSFNSFLKSFGSFFFNSSPCPSRNWWKFLVLETGFVPSFIRRRQHSDPLWSLVSRKSKRGRNFGAIFSKSGSIWKEKFSMIGCLNHNWN